MNRELKKPLWISLLVILSTYLAFDLIVTIIILTSTSYYRGYGYFQVLFSLIGTKSLLISFAILSKRHPILLMPIFSLLSISFVSLLAEIIYYSFEEAYFSWQSIIELVFESAIIALSIISFIIANPFKKKSGDTSCQENHNIESKTESNNVSHRTIENISLDDIYKAKDLLDAGAITQEEYYEIKRRFFK